MFQGLPAKFPASGGSEMRPRVSKISSQQGSPKEDSIMHNHLTRAIDRKSKKDKTYQNWQIVVYDPPALDVASIDNQNILSEGQC